MRSTRTRSRLPADRGTILDRNGAHVGRKRRRERCHRRSLGRIERDQDRARPISPTNSLRYLGEQKSLLAAKLTGSSQFVYLARGVTPQIANAIQALKLPGVTMQATKKRVYPANNVAANVLGFVGSDGKGLGGLEYQYQKVLAGKNGQLTVELGHNGQVIPDGIGQRGRRRLRS